MSSLATFWWIKNYFDDIIIVKFFGVHSLCNKLPLFQFAASFLICLAVSYRVFLFIALVFWVGSAFKRLMTHSKAVLRKWLLISLTVGRWQPHTHRRHFYYKEVKRILVCKWQKLSYAARDSMVNGIAPLSKGLSETNVSRSRVRNPVPDEWPACFLIMEAVVSRSRPFLWCVWAVSPGKDAPAFHGEHNLAAPVSN